MEISPRDRRALVMGVCALAVIVLYFAVLEPVWGWYDRMADAHATAALRLGQAVYDRQKQVHQREQVREWEAVSGSLGAPKLYAEGMTYIGAQIIAAGQSSGVELQGTSPGAGAPWVEDPRLQQSVIQIDGKADWENVFKFITALYRIEGVLSVEQMDLSISDPKKPGKLNLRLSVSVLLQGESGGGAKWAS
jgi:hypothetical protein